MSLQQSAVPGPGPGPGPRPGPGKIHGGKRDLELTLLTFVGQEGWVEGYQ